MPTLLSKATDIKLIKLNAKMLATIYKFNTEFSENNSIRQLVTNANSDDAVISFKEWANSLTHKKFQISSSIIDFTIIFTMYNRGPTKDRHTIVIIDIVYNSIKSTSSYRVKDQLKFLDIDNMSDIISMFVKICTNDIRVSSICNMIDLFELRMTTIATKVN